MILMSIDQSLSCSGVMVWEKGDVKQALLIKTPTSLSVIERIRDISVELEQMITEYKITHIVIESLPYGLNSTSVRPLAGLYYCIQNLCIDLHIQFAEANVTAVKKFATGSGRAKKPEMIAAAQLAAPKLFKNIMDSGVKKTTGLADLADSYFIGAYFGNKFSEKD